MYEAPRIEATETIAGALTDFASKQLASDAEVKFGAEQLADEQSGRTELGRD